MKVAISLFIVAILSIFSSPFAEANSLEPCDSVQCKEYFNSYKIYTRRGHSEAMATLAELYFVGYGTEQNTKLALKWFRRAAKFGSATSQYKAAVIYLREPNYLDVDKGINYLEKSAKNGFIPASYMLGKIYYGSSIADADFEKADKYLSQAFTEGYPRTAGFIQQLIEIDGLKKLPQLTSLYNQVVTQKADSGIQFPKNEMETIEVAAPDVSAYFDTQLARLNNSIPDTSSGTGSKIAGRTCAEMWGCSGEYDKQKQQDFMMSDWGKIAAIFYP